MKLFIGLDVLLAKTAVCALNEHGKIVKEAQVASDPAVIVHFTGGLDSEVTMMGLEAVPCRSGCIATSRMPGQMSFSWRPDRSKGP